MAAGGWKNTRPCCVITWSTLALLGEHSKTFDVSGDLALRRLTYWAGSDQAREARARALAVQLDSTFRDLFGSKYETNVKKTQAILGMTAVLLDGDKTMADLAEADDLLYLFLGEEAS